MAAAQSPPGWEEGARREREALPAHALPSRRILAFAPTNHHASLRVMEKCGMRRLKTDTYQGTECVFYEAPL